MVGAIYLLSLETAAFAFAISRFSKNLIKIVFKVIPLFFASVILANWILGDFLAIYNGGNLLLKVFSLLLPIIAGMVVAEVITAREKRVDVI